MLKLPLPGDAGRCAGRRRGNRRPHPRRCRSPCSRGRSREPVAVGLDSVLGDQREPKRLASRIQAWKSASNRPVDVGEVEYGVGPGIELPLSSMSGCRDTSAVADPGRVGHGKPRPSTSCRRSRPRWGACPRPLIDRHVAGAISLPMRSRRGIDAVIEVALAVGDARQLAVRTPQRMAEHTISTVSEARSRRAVPRSRK